MIVAPALASGSERVLDVFPHHISPSRTIHDLAACLTTKKEWPGIVSIVLSSIERIELHEVCLRFLQCLPCVRLSGTPEDVQLLDCESLSCCSRSIAHFDDHRFTRRPFAVFTSPIS